MRFPGMVFFFACILIIRSVSFSQTTSDLSPSGDPGRYPHSALFLEIGGPCVFYSVDYDYRLSDHYGLHVGYSSWSLDNFFFIDHMEFTGVPVTAEYLLGDGASRLELDAGVTIASLSFSGTNSIFGSGESGGVTRLIGQIGAGYRFQPPQGGMFFRVGVVPMFSEYGSTVTAQLSLGLTF